MDNGKIRMIFLSGIMSCFSFLLSFAQPVIKTSVDKREILIGDQFKLTIEATFLPDTYKIGWPLIPDSLPHFEVINRDRMDSMYSNNRLSGIVQTLTLTSFDSGKWVLPSFQIAFVPVNNGSSEHFFTDSVPVSVSFSTTDTTSQLKDIKPIRDAETTNTALYWIGAAVLLVALIIFLIWFYGYWKRNKSLIPFQTKSSPYDVAMKELENLKSFNLTEPGEIKIIHIKLNEILIRYLSGRQKINYLNKTTGDILILLRDQYHDNNILTKAAASLRCADAVKFAKYLPPPYETENCLQSVKEIIHDIQHQPPILNHQPS